ncbi:MAG: hypothetical protein DRP87_06165 [Spirochaetes bacterium]|nr:MAG: hypothetical protein DRP87_06165 [Spirochaetota bacterium]
MKRVPPFLFLILMVIYFFIIDPLFALELKQGRVKLILHENLGRFSLFYMSDVSRERYTPLLLDQDPRTSVFSVLMGNKVFRMGETSGFSQTVEKVDDGARFIWTSSMLEITKTFTFITSRGSALSNGVRIDIQIKNISEQDQSIGIRYLLDTYLGEKSGVHFKTKTTEKFSNEAEFLSSNMPEYCFSPSSEIENVGFQLITKGKGITIPDKIVLANWKRLNDTSWSYQARTNRNFNHLPYSINDSAICVYYNPVNISPGGTRKVVMVMGNFDPEGYASVTTKPEDKKEITDIFDQAVKTGETPDSDKEISVRTDLITIRDLLVKLNSKLNSPETVENEEISVMRQVLETLEKRKNQYEK